MNDYINGLFELVGALVVCLNVRRVLIDKGYAGVSIRAGMFFFAWSLWNVFYLLRLHQWFSLLCSSMFAFSYVVWLTVMLLFGRKQ